VVRRVAEEIFMPFTVGGGIRTLEDATRLIQAGAEKVSINSAAVRTPELVTAVARKFGRCATVVNIDPHQTQEGLAVIPASLGLPPSFTVQDLLADGDGRFQWRIGHNYVRLGPGQAHLARVEP